VAEQGEGGSCLQRCALNLTQTALELADASLACGDRCASVKAQSPGCGTLWKRAVQGAACDWRMPPPPPPFSAPPPRGSVRAATLAPLPIPQRQVATKLRTTRRRATGYRGVRGGWRSGRRTAEEKT
jgi:hypothetical protein